MTLLDSALIPHGRSVFDKTIMAASLDHALWFHRPCRADEWLLYAQDSPSLAGARGFSRGLIFASDGTLVASVAQEGLLRERRHAGLNRGRCFRALRSVNLRRSRLEPIGSEREQHIATPSRPPRRGLGAGFDLRCGRAAARERAAPAAAQAPAAFAAPAQRTAGSRPAAPSSTIRARASQNRVRALKFRGLAHYRGGDIERAAADFTAATTLAPDDPEGWINLGMMRQTRGDLDGAVADYDKAIALDPASWVAHVNRGNALRLEERSGRRHRGIRCALGLKPDLGAALRGRGLARQMRGDLRGAIADTTAALRIDPRDAEALLARGNALRLQRRCRQGARRLRGGDPGAPEQAGAWLNRGAVLMEQGNIDGAIESFDKTIALNPGSVEAYNNRGAAREPERRFRARGRRSGYGAAARPQPGGRLRQSRLRAPRARRLRGRGRRFQRACEPRSPTDPYRVLWRHLALVRAGTRTRVLRATPRRSGRARGRARCSRSMPDRSIAKQIMAMGPQVEPAERAERRCEIVFYVGEYALTRERPGGGGSAPARGRRLLPGRLARARRRHRRAQAPAALMRLRICRRAADRGIAQRGASRLG